MVDGSVKLDQVGLETIGGGAAPELFARELAAVLENIDDPNTVAKAKRVITLEVVFEPNEGRDYASLEVRCKSKLVAATPAASGIHITRQAGALVALGKNPQQTTMFDVGPGAVLKGGPDA